MAEFCAAKACGIGAALARRLPRHRQARDYRGLTRQMRLCGNWGADYSLARHNCNSFTMAFLFALGFKEEVFPSALLKRPESWLYGNNRFLGHWSVHERRCAGLKCLEWATIGCSQQCRWSDGASIPNQCVDPDSGEVREVVAAETVQK